MWLSVLAARYVTDTVGFGEVGHALILGGILLMALGSQWYILFYVIEATTEVPSDMHDLASDLGMP